MPARLTAPASGLFLERVLLQGDESRDDAPAARPPRRLELDVALKSPGWPGWPITERPPVTTSEDRVPRTRRTTSA